MGSDLLLAAVLLYGAVPNDAYIDHSIRQKLDSNPVMVDVLKAHALNQQLTGAPFVSSFFIDSTYYSHDVRLLRQRHKNLLGVPYAGSMQRYGSVDNLLKKLDLANEHYLYADAHALSTGDGALGHDRYLDKCYKRINYYHALIQIYRHVNGGDVYNARMSIRDFMTTYGNDVYYGDLKNPIPGLDHLFEKGTLNGRAIQVQ